MEAIQEEKEEKERNMTEEEKEAEEKKAYSKLFFTNNYDWKIRKELDAADLLIHNDTKKAIDQFEDILKRYPESPRAKYALLRSKVNEQRFREKTKTTNK
jgi:TolA-binding protein